MRVLLEDFAWYEEIDFYDSSYQETAFFSGAFKVWAYQTKTIQSSRIDSDRISLKWIIENSASCFIAYHILSQLFQQATGSDPNRTSANDYKTFFFNWHGKGVCFSYPNLKIE